MRSIIDFNQGWLYAARELPLHAPDSDFSAVTLPHSNKIVPHHNFDVSEYAFVSTYRKRFTLPEALNGRRLFVDFEGVMLAATVYINGHGLGEHDGGYTPFSHDITPYLREGDNIIQVRVDSTERPDIPPFGYIVDYLTFGGIYREVSLRYVEPVYIKDIFVRTKDVLSGVPGVEVDVLLAVGLLELLDLVLQRLDQQALSRGIGRGVVNGHGMHWKILSGLPPSSPCSRRTDVADCQCPCLFCQVACLNHDV